MGSDRVRVSADGSEATFSFPGAFSFRRTNADGHGTALEEFGGGNADVDVLLQFAAALIAHVQTTPARSREYALVATKLEEALHWLLAERVRRKVSTDAQLRACVAGGGDGVVVESLGPPNT